VLQGIKALKKHVAVSATQMNALEVVKDRKNSIRSVILNGEAVDRL